MDRYTPRLGCWSNREHQASNTIMVIRCNALPAHFYQSRQQVTIRPGLITNWANKNIRVTRSKVGRDLFAFSTATCSCGESSKRLSWPLKECSKLCASLSRCAFGPEVSEPSEQTTRWRGPRSVATDSTSR